MLDLTKRRDHARASSMRNSQDLWIGVSRDLLIIS
jgi:hypothetical protein